MNKKEYTIKRRSENDFDIERLERMTARLRARNSKLLPAKEGELEDRKSLQKIEDDGEFLDEWQKVFDRITERRNQ